MKKTAFLLLPVLFGLVLRAQTPPSGSEDLRTRVNHLMATHVTGVEQLVPPGWTISAKPVAMQPGPNDTVLIQLHIFIKGAPAGTIFQEQSMPVGSDQTNTDMEGITLGKDGILMCSGRSPVLCGDPQNLDDPIEFTAQSIKGEPLRFVFTSAAGKIGIVVVPNPVADRNKGCTLDAVRLTPGFEVALITGTGFPPDTDVHFLSTPNPPSAPEVIRSDTRGVIRFSMIPHAHSGQKEGTLKLKITEPQCSPEVSYHWGGY